MIRTVVLLALIASVSANKLWNTGFSQIFSINPLTWTSSSMVSLPQTKADAIEAGWEELEGPTTLTGYDDLTMMMLLSEPTTGLYFDGDYLAGLLICMPVDKVTPYFNTTAQGLISWNNTIDGVTTSYLTSIIYFVPENNSSRTYDKDEIIQADNLSFISNDCIIDTIPKNLTDIKQNSSSVWYVQKCVPLMGLHYYRSMTTSTTCDSAFCPFFGLFDDNTNQMIGIGYMMIGECDCGSTFEDPSQTAVEYIVNNGPDCLYTLVGKYGACTRHIYFVDTPYFIVC